MTSSALTRAAQRPVRSALTAFLAVIVLAGLIYSLIEVEASWTDGIWWALVTATTVGYGDISPVSLEGRLLAGTVIFTGIATVAIMTANLAGYLAAQRIEGAYGTPELDDDVDFLIAQMEAFKRRILEEQDRDARIMHAARRICDAREPAARDQAVRELAQELGPEDDATRGAGPEAGAGDSTRQRSES